MREISISFDKEKIVKLFRGKAYKVAESLANDQNFKAVYNIKHGGEEDIVDTRISDSLYAKRVGLLRAILAEYTTRTYEIDNEPAGIELNVPQTSTATDIVVTPAAEEYITEGMLADWISLVAPTLEKQFLVSTANAEDSLKRIIYNKKAPTP